jgi:hypothetical protein
MTVNDLERKTGRYHARPPLKRQQRDSRGSVAEHRLRARKAERGLGLCTQLSMPSGRQLVTSGRRHAVWASSTRVVTTQKCVSATERSQAPHIGRARNLNARRSVPARIKCARRPEPCARADVVESTSARMREAAMRSSNKYCGRWSQQPGKPRPPGNPRGEPDRDRPPVVEEPPEPIPSPPPEGDEPAPMRTHRPII